MPITQGMSISKPAPPRHVHEWEQHGDVMTCACGASKDVVHRAPPKPAAPDVPRASLTYILDYCSTNPKRFKSMHAHVAAVREWLEKIK